MKRNPKTKHKRMISSRKRKAGKVPKLRRWLSRKIGSWYERKLHLNPLGI